MCVLRPESRKSVQTAGGELEPRHEQRLVCSVQNRSVDTFYHHVISVSVDSGVGLILFTNLSLIFCFNIIFFHICTPHVPSSSSSSSCFLTVLLHSPVFSFVSSGPQFRTDGQTDGQLAARRGKLEQLSGDRLSMFNKIKVSV